MSARARRWSSCTAMPGVESAVVKCCLFRPAVPLAATPAPPHLPKCSSSVTPDNSVGTTCACLCRYPPEADRKYMVVYWDHGNGWLGYGADATCSSAGPYNDHYYCSIASLATLTQGELPQG